MKDFIKKYQNHKFMTNVNIVLASLVLATLLNVFVIDGTIWQSLKTSILNSNVSNEKADVFIKKINNELFLVANKNMNNLNTLALSISYNPENITLSDIKSELWQIANISNTDWISSVILTTDKPKNIVKWDKLLQIITSKKEEKTENINIVNANFSDDNKGQYLLSTSGITF